ncbi:MAG: serine/threonine-protein kinase [Acidobacteriota bacterium]
MKVCPVCEKQYEDTQSLCPVDAAALQAEDDSLVGQTLAGKYSIEELIKTGGMGSVYRGKHVLMDKTVAVKVLRKALAADDVVVARFSREAKAASRISHPHAVSVTDFGEAENGVVFLVMEYLHGQTLKDIIKQEGAMSLERTVEIIRQVTGALDAAHHQGVIHRDLKSDNIMLSETNGGDWARVLDFGIAKIQEPEGSRDNDITAPNLVIGTPQYMSPEQCAQTGPIDARSDVYSLGIIVFEMLSGRLPFTGESPTVIMMKQVQDPPPSILEARPDLPAAVNGVVEKALSKQPVDRFQTAGQLSEALSAIASASDAPAAVAVAAAPATVPNERVKIEDDADEVTVVRPREVAPPVRARREIPLPPPSVDRRGVAEGFSPWRILVPAAIVLVVVFGIVFLLTRGSSPSQPTNQLNANTSLVADPNSQPVQSTGAPTGDSERNIQPVTLASPGSSPVATPSPQSTKVPSTVTGDFGADSNKNTSPPRETPAPKSSPVDDAPPPPPKPSPSVKTVVKPAVTPPI